MKRLEGTGAEASGEISGREPTRGAKRLRKPRRLARVASPIAEWMRAAGIRGARARDFEDFVRPERSWSALALPAPDPGFREGLRRRLWRIQVLTRGHRGFVRH